MGGVPGLTAQWTNGTAEVSDSDKDNLILAAPGAGKVLHVTNIVVGIKVESTGSDGTMGIEDGAGGTEIFGTSTDADISGWTSAFSLTFGEFGYPLTVNTGLNLTVAGGTASATVRATAIAWIAG